MPRRKDRTIQNRSTSAGKVRHRYYGCINCRKTLYWNADMMSFFHDHNGSAYCLGTVGPIGSPIIQAVKGDRAILALFDRQTPAETDMVESVLRAKSYAKPVGAIPVDKWEAEYLYNQVEAEITWLSHQDSLDNGYKRDADRLHHLARKIKRVWKQPGMRER